MIPVNRETGRELPAEMDLKFGKARVRG